MVIPERPRPAIIFAVVSIATAGTTAGTTAIATAATTVATTATTTATTTTVRSAVFAEMSPQDPVAVRGLLRDTRGPAERAVVYLLPDDAGAEAALTTQAPGPTTTVVMDQAHLRFQPEVVAIMAGSTVEFLNSDPIMHNVFSPSGRGADFDLGTYPATESRRHTFDMPGTFLMLCHVHPEMAGWVIVLPRPTFAVTDEAGEFSIPEVVPGRYEARVWYRRRDVAIGALDVTPDGLTDWQVTIARPGRR